MRSLSLLTCTVGTLLVAAALVAAFLLSAIGTAEAQAICGPHGEVVKKLQGDFKEARAGLGLAGNGGLVELFVSEKGGWSVLVTRPDGQTCLVAAGENWEIVKPNFGKAGEEG